MNQIKGLFYFSLLGVINVALRITPTFSGRRAILTLARCSIETSATIHRGLRLFGFGRLKCGSDVTINRGVYIDARAGVSVGNNATIAHECRIYTLGHDIDDPSFQSKGAAVSIGNHAVLFAGVKVMPGVTVGEGAVIFPYSVVTKSIPAGEVWGGNPAKKIRERDINIGQIEYHASYAQWLGN